MPKRFRRSESGATAIEFALVAMPLLMLLGAIIEVSLMLTAQFELQHAVENTARLIRTGGVAARVPPMSENDFRSVVCSRVVLVRDCAASIHFDLRNSTSFANLAAVATEPRNVGPQNQGDIYISVFQPGGSDRPGRLVVTYDWSFVFPFLGVFGNLPNIEGSRRIYGLAVFMNEPF